VIGSLNGSFTQSNRHKTLRGPSLGVKEQYVGAPASLRKDERQVVLYGTLLICAQRSVLKIHITNFTSELEIAATNCFPLLFACLADDEGSTSLRKVGRFLPDYAASQTPWP
jgi:hypothetical protein